MFNGFYLRKDFIKIMKNIKYVKNPQIEYCELDNTIILNTDENILVLESFETSIFVLFDGEKNLSEISEILSKNYSFYNEEDFIDFANLLISKGVLIKK